MIFKTNADLAFTTLHFLIQFCLIFAELKVRESSFIQENSCNLQERIDNGCIELKPGASKTLVTCAAQCQDKCIGVVWRNNRDCYIQRPCLTPINCSTTEGIFYNRVNPCQHEGIWNKVTDTCKCIDGWVGERCERLPVHCRELRDYGYPTGWENGIWVRIDLRPQHDPVKIQCILLNSNRGKMENWMLMKNIGRFDNNKTMKEYIEGYENSNDDISFWIGLDTIKALNDFGLDDLILSTGLYDQYDTYHLIERIYRYFHIGGASSGYELDLLYSFTYAKSYSSHMHDYGDCLGPLEGARFSTWDIDNDEDDTRNCASEAGVGWWFKDCDMTCNPLGWSYEVRPGPEIMSHIKMIGVNYGAGSPAKNWETLMYFQTVE